MSSKLKGSLLANCIQITSDDKILVLPICTMEKYVHDISSWNEYFGANGILHEKIKRELMAVGASPDNLSFYNYLDRMNEIKVSDYEYLVIPGGDVELGIKRINDLKLKEVIVQFAGDIIAYSAGALLLYRQFFLSPNWYYKNMKFCDGIDVVNMPSYLIEVHYDHSKKMRMNVYEAMNYYSIDCVLIGDEGILSFDSSSKLTEKYGDVTYIKYCDRQKLLI